MEVNNAPWRKGGAVLPVHLILPLLNGGAYADRRDKFVVTKEDQQKESEQDQLVFEVMRMEKCPVSVVQHIHQLIPETD